MIIEALRQLVGGFWEWWGSLPAWGGPSLVATIIVYNIIIIRLMADQTHYYKQAGGKLYVKHGRLGEWVEVGQHMKEGHHNGSV